jgi:hypothetical protein
LLIAGGPICSPLSHSRPRISLGIATNPVSAQWGRMGSGK